MGHIRSIGWFPGAAILVAACSVSPSPSGPPLPTHTPITRPDSPSLAAASPAPTPAGEGEVVVTPEIQVIYVNHEATVWTSAFAGGGKTAPAFSLPIASAVIDFGDGSTGSVSQACSAPSSRLRLQHVFASAGSYMLSMSSAVLCESGWQLALDDGEDIRALPAATRATADWPVCTTYQLNMTEGWTGAGLGNVATLIRLSNVSKVGCSLKGYPGLQLVSATGSLLPTHVRLAADGDYMFPSIAVGRVAVGPGEVAAFEVGYTDTPSGPANDEPYDVACPPARWVRVILPQTQQWGTAKAPLAPCEGNVNVSPIFPGGERVDFPGS